MPRRFQSISVVLLALACAGLGGCATSQHSSRNSEPTRHHPGAGASWASVMATPAVVQADAGFVADRRDDDLQPREHRLATALDEWPRPDRPSLERDRYFRVSNPRSDGFIYYGSGEPSRYDGGIYWRLVGNTLTYSVIGSLLTVAVCAACGYALAVFRFRGRAVVLAAVLGSMLIPNTVLAQPIYLLVVELGLIRSTEVADDRGHVVMIMTTPFCPYAPQLLEQTRRTAQAFLGLPTTIEMGLEMWDPSMMEDGVADDWGLF